MSEAIFTEMVRWDYTDAVRLAARMFETAMEKNLPLEEGDVEPTLAIAEACLRAAEVFHVAAREHLKAAGIKDPLTVEDAGQPTKQTMGLEKVTGRFTVGG